MCSFAPYSSQHFYYCACVYIKSYLTVIFITFSDFRDTAVIMAEEYLDTIKESSKKGMKKKLTPFIMSRSASYHNKRRPPQKINLHSKRKHELVTNGIYIYSTAYILLYSNF